MSVRALDAMRAAGSEPLRLEYYPAKVCDSLPEPPLGTRWIVTSANPAWPVTLLQGVRSSGRLVACGTDDPMRRYGAQPLWLHDAATQSCDVLAKSELGGD